MAGKLLNYELWEKCSPQAERLITNWHGKRGVGWKPSEYPLAGLNIGQCLVFTFDNQPREIKEISLRVAMYTKAKLLGIKITVVKHSDLRMYEVARIE